MSAHNRSRRGFRCQNRACGVRLDRDQTRAHLARAAELCRRLGCPDAPEVCFCGRCGTPHRLADGRPGLRLLTPAERVRAEVEIPAVLRLAEAGALPGPLVAFAEVVGC